MAKKVAPASCRDGGATSPAFSRRASFAACSTLLGNDSSSHTKQDKILLYCDSCELAGIANNQARAASKEVTAIQAQRNF